MMINALIVLVVMSVTWLISVLLRTRHVWRGVLISGAIMGAYLAVEAYARNPALVFGTVLCGGITGILTAVMVYQMLKNPPVDPNRPKKRHRWANLLGKED